MQRKAFSFVELLLAAAIVAALGTVLFPVAAQKRKSKISNRPNLEKIAAAAIAYSSDYDGKIVILENGPYRNLVNTSDETLTRFGEKRTDAWPLILLPYVKDRKVFQDPRRDDVYNIWTRAPHATTDPGYSPMGATYRNQSRFPNFGVNYLFLSPMVDTDDQDLEQGITKSISKSFSQADDPAHTIFYVTSMRGSIPTANTDHIGVLDTTRGFYVVNAPGMWGIADPKRPSWKTIVYSAGTDCSGDWCGDVDPKTAGKQRSTNFAYIERVLGGNNVAFLDGHVKFMKDTDMTAGTNYLEAVPNGEANFGGAVITNKKRYLWNLDNDYYGLY
jgi:prepilin-type processing-associated H-X9-DG protein